nr:unnamed protein product [Spirometra erinaceieuropaei]
MPPCHRDLNRPRPRRPPTVLSTASPRSDLNGGQSRCGTIGDVSAAGEAGAIQVPISGDAVEEKQPLIFYDNRLAYHPAFPEGCDFRCRFTSDLSQLKQSQLAVFTANPPANANIHSGNALWAFESAEPPHRRPWISEKTKKRLSMFITYHPYATVPYYYGVYRAFNNPECVMSEAQRERLRRQNSIHLLPAHHLRRTKKVAWAVSDNEPLNNRTKLGNAIAKYIEVDRYGRRAKHCPLAGYCFEQLSREYKFYLSFENANCEGYITEKFFVNALAYGMVPIVYGASREEFYARAPPNSYIHVDDFKTVKELASYLNYLDKNDTAYASYFAWREHGEVLTWLRVDCRVCGVLHHVLAGRLKLYDSTYKTYLDETRTCTNTSKINF